MVSGRHDEKGQALAAELRNQGAQAEFIRADVRREQDVRALVDKTVERFGGLDVAVNNAGTEGKPGPITEQTPESYTAVFDTNVLGVLLSLEATSLRVMRPAGPWEHRQCLVGCRARWCSERVGICAASKHAVDGLTQAAALEAAEIRRPRELDCARDPSRHR